MRQIIGMILMIIGISGLIWLSLTEFSAITYLGNAIRNLRDSKTYQDTFWFFSGVLTGIISNWLCLLLWKKSTLERLKSAHYVFRTVSCGVFLVILLLMMIDKPGQVQAIYLAPIWLAVLVIFLVELNSWYRRGVITRSCEYNRTHQAISELHRQTEKVLNLLANPNDDLTSRKFRQVP